MTESANETVQSAPDLDRPLICGGCGFDLRAAADRCPECGRRFDRDHLIDALIPWEQRKHIGRVKAYVWTLLLVTFRPWRVASKLGKPVSVADAIRFRRVTVGIAFLSLLGAALSLRPWASATYDQPVDWRNEWVLLLTSPWSLGIGAAGVLWALSLASRAAVPFFNCRRLGSPQLVRAVAIGHYTSAALAWAPVAVVLMAAVWQSNPPDWRGFPTSDAPEWLHRLLGGDQGGPLLFCETVLVRLSIQSLCVAIGLIALWLWSTLYLLRAATGRGAKHLFAAGVLLPAVWTALLVIIPLAIELLAAFVAVVVLSFL